MNVGSLVKAPIKKALSRIDSYRSERDIRNLYKAKNWPAHENLSRFPMPELGKEQKADIDAFWAQYGIKILDYSWYRWYYGVTGKADPRFIPQDIYSYIVWPYHDNEEFCLAWKDKNLFERFCPSVPFPQNYIRRINGRFFDKDGAFLQERTSVLDVLDRIHGSVIVKDAWDSGEGRGVKKYTLESRADSERLLKEWEGSRNVLIQELIYQNHVFSQFNESSVNIMRINSWRNGNEIKIFSPTLRIGTPGQATDICYIDGIETVSACAITMDGHFGEKIVNQFGESKKTAEAVSEPNAVIPHWNEIIEAIKTGHRQIDHFDLIGWDFTVTQDERIVCVEYNIKRPGTVFYQYVNGPFFGDYTDEVLSFLKEKDNQEKWVPSWMRL